MDALLDVPMPRFADAIRGATIYDWLKKGRAVEQIIENGFAELKIDPALLEHHAPRIYEGLGRMIIEPESFMHLPSRNDELPEDMESGLMKRDDDELKWQFHSYVGIESVLRSRKAPVHNFTEFFQSANELDEAAFYICCALALQFDERNQGDYEGSMAKSVIEGKRVLRCLLYLLHQRRKAAPDAKAHTDRGWGSVHWISSHPGLKMINRHGKVISVRETDPDTVLIFPGRKFGTLASGRWGYGTVHGVRDENRSARRGDFRKAIVSFVHSALNEAQRARHLEYLDKGYFKPNDMQLVI